MGALRTAASSGSVQGIIKWFEFTTLDDTDTFVGPATGKYWFGQTDNPTTQANVGISIGRSSGTYTFYPGENGASGTLFVENKGS